jgi:glycosyltransferase involved in cell wall biosynthesis
VSRGEDIRLHVAVSGWLLGEPSGANRRLLALLAHIAPQLAAGERITVLHRPDFVPGALPGRLAFQPIAIPAGPTWRRVRAERRLLPAALHTLRANVFDHGFLPLPRTAVPTCLLLHDVRAADGQTRWPRWFARWHLRASCARAAAIVVPSAFTAGRVRALAPSAAIPTVVGNGIELPEPSPPPAAPGNGHLLHTGHLEPRKNLDVVLQALALLPPQRRPDLVLVGRDAGSADHLQQLAARLGIARSLHVRGVLADSEVATLCATARAVVVPSTYEGFGLAALEGLACGRPTLVAAAGALPEVVGEAGTCLPPHDAAAWARAIDATATGGAAAAPARRQRAAQFAWPAAGRRLLEVWRSIADRARQRH